LEGVEKQMTKLTRERNFNTIHYSQNREADMASEHFIETGKGTFYGEYIYDRVVPKDHFFRKLNEMLDWRKYTQKMMRWYKGGAEYGRPPFSPAVLLKMLLVAYLYNLSERQTEQYNNVS